MTDPDDGQDWPEGVTEEDGKLFKHGLLLVPEGRVEQLSEQWHHRMMHPGVNKMKQDMERRFLLPVNDLKGYLKGITKACPVCQACNPPNQDHSGVQKWTPIPDTPMESVSMDIFSMPLIKVGKETFDAVVLVVDRHSGYLVAVPVHKTGLCAKTVAVTMIRHWLTVFGVPTSISSDRGPQFTGG